VKNRREKRGDESWRGEIPKSQTSHLFLCPENLHLQQTYLNTVHSFINK